MEEKDLDIFILGYKAFEPKVSNPTYKIVDGGQEEFETQLQKFIDTDGDSISSLNGFYSELTYIYWIWKNYPLKKYVGFCHYRRYFTFFDEIPNMDEIFQEYDIILPRTYKTTRSMYNQYKSCHNVNDLVTCMGIVKVLYPDYMDDVHTCVYDDKAFYTNNCFIMKREDFLKYCEFIFTVLQNYLQFKKLNNMEDIQKMVEENSNDYLKKRSPNSEVWYQCRIGGFLAERLLTWWVKHNFDPQRIKIIPIKVTEKKY